MPHPTEQQRLLRALHSRLRLDAGLGAEYIAGGEAILRTLAALTKQMPKQMTPPAHPPRPAASPVPSRELPSVPAAQETQTAKERPQPEKIRPPAHVSLVPFAPPEPNPEKEALLAALKKESETCALCPLCEKRNTVVWGEGSLDADVLFVGEGPGRDEDIEGRPFVGRSGRLLTDIIEKGMRRPRSSVYIANVVKCRPPGNRDPRPDEVSACSAYLKKQIETIAPKAVVAVGTVAARALLGLPESARGAPGLRGRWHEYEGIPLRVLYHPSYLLRLRRTEEERTEADRETWREVQEIVRYVDELKRR